MRLAMNGRGTVEPNPMVGCVIVKGAQIIGEGWHAKFGGPHAEPNALSACSVDPAGATAYVTLEPCCHLNKKTPPCAPRLIAAGVARVVVGCLDPNPEVNGRGLARLAAAGVRAESGALEPECKQLIAPFIARTIFHRPYVTLKWAQSADAKIAGPAGRRMQISNERANRAVHRLRSRCDAIAVGVNTVLMDDPLLTARGASSARPLIRCILDHRLRTPINSQLVTSSGESRVIIACDPQLLETTAAAELRSRGVELLGIHTVDDLLLSLSGQGVSHLLVEPGPTLARSLFGAGLVDRLWLLDCQISVNDASAPGAAAVPPQFVQTGTRDFHGDQLREYLNPNSSVYFAPEPSADFVLEAEAELPPPC